MVKRTTLGCPWLAASFVSVLLILNATSQGFVTAPGNFQSLPGSGSAGGSGASGRTGTNSGLPGSSGNSVNQSVSNGTFINNNQGSFTGGGFSFTGGGLGSSFGSVSNQKSAGGSSPASTSFLGQYNSSPLGLGAGLSQKSSFGSPIVGSTGGTSSGSGQSRGGATRGGATMGGMGASSMRSGRSSGGMSGSSTPGSMAGANERIAVYMTETSFDSPALRERSTVTGMVAPRVLTEVQGTFARSGRFQGESAITVLNQGSVIVLRGKVATDKDRRVAESMVRLSPGVRQVLNEIEIAENPE